MSEGPKQVFADRLALLRSAAGQPTYETIERGARLILDPTAKDNRGQARAAPSHKRVNDWCNGRAVPAGWPQLELVLRVLIERARADKPRPAVEGLYGLAAWQALWKAARENSDTDRAVCPYRGLEAFQPEHANSFHGRRKSTIALMARLGTLARDSTGGPLMLVGPSGVGKSSLLRAGVVPAIREDGLSTAGSDTWPIILTTPGQDPLVELTRHIPSLARALQLDTNHPQGPDNSADNLASADPDTPPDETRPPSRAMECLAGEPPALDLDAIRHAVRAHATQLAGPTARLVIIVDQFEEVFTLADPTQRHIYIEALHAASTPVTPAAPAPALVVVAVRADFYEPCLDHPTLAEALQDRQMVLGPMSADEVREAIVRPATSVGLRVEPGLVELLLRDVGLRRPHGTTTEAGVLPLLSHALAATWEKRKKGTLTVEGYYEAGGIHGAVEASAEQAWTRLHPEAQRAALHLLLKLTRIGREGIHDTRGRADKTQLLTQSHNPQAAENALETLVGARLVTVDADFVQLAHEALLNSWARLRRMIDERRADLLLGQQVEEDAAKWQRREASLYRGDVLKRARSWAKKEPLYGPSELARTFLTRSTRARRLVLGSVVVALLAYGATAVIASKQRDDAQFSAVVAEADRLEATDPSLAAQLDLVAHHLRTDDPEVNGRVLATQNAPLAKALPGSFRAIYDTSFSPDGHILATATEGQTVQLWNLADSAHPAPLGDPLAAGTSWVSAARFSPDGHTLASSNGDGTVHLWNTTDPAHPKPLTAPLNSHDGSISLLAFSPDGRTLATADDNNTVRLWDLTDPSHPVLGPALTGHTDAVRSVAFSPDGHLLAAGGNDNTALLWNIADRTHPIRVGPPLTGHTATVHSVAFSPDGRLLATGSDDKTARLWNITDPANPSPIGPLLTGHQGLILSVAFSPDGRLLATGSGDGTAKLWNLSNPANPTPVGDNLATNNAGVWSVAFSPDGRTLSVGTQDGTTLLWALPSTVILGPADRVTSVAFSPDGRTLAIAGHDDTIRLMNVSNPGMPSPLGPPLSGHTGFVIGVAFSPNGRVLASESPPDRTVRLWDVHDPTHTTEIGAPTVRRTQIGGAVAFSPDGHILATDDTDHTVQLWDATNPAQLTPLGPPLVGHTGYVLYAAFSPDGHTLATASADGTARLWNVTDPAHASALGTPLDPHTGQVVQLAFSPDGHTLALTGEDKLIHRFDVTDPSRPTALAPLAGHDRALLAVAFSPDGGWLASGSSDKTARIWNLHDSTAPPEVLTGHSGTVKAVAFNPTGEWLATGSEDNTVLLWNLNVADAAARICQSTGESLTAQQWQRILPEQTYRPPC